LFVLINAVIERKDETRTGRKNVSEKSTQTEEERKPADVSRG